MLWKSIGADAALHCLQDASADAINKAREEADQQARKQLQAILDDGSKTEAQRKAAREALKKQAEEAKAVFGAVEREIKEKQELEKRIQEMEGKVGKKEGGTG